jgi:hypothetical protein
MNALPLYLSLGPSSDVAHRISTDSNHPTAGVHYSPFAETRQLAETKQVPRRHN